ncbi:MAG: NTP transferase domain-containing protein [Candidatus Poseidoniaceae archaeon]|nr:NTP transferase domain-containing protein [Candidatus Poseidoniaceae archaeon]
MAKSVPAVVLAAGASARLGMPKAMVEWNGETLVGRSVRLLKESGCSPIVVVTRQELLVEIALECKDANVVVNNEPEAGRTGSIQAGLMSLISDKGKTPRQVFIVPVDRCGWNISTIESLIGKEGNVSPAPSGHPLLLSDIEKVLSASKDESLREIISISKINAPGEYMNIDRPEDLEGLN